MQTSFEPLITTARITNGCANMITIEIPFRYLPKGAEFRFGYEQDDYDMKKTSKYHYKISYKESQFDKPRYKIKSLEKMVLLDYFLPK